MDLPHVQTLYHSEHDRRVELIKSTMSQVPVMAILVTGAIVLMDGGRAQFSYVLGLVSYALFVFILGSMVAQLIFLKRAFNDFLQGFAYSYLPLLQFQVDRHRAIESAVTNYYAGMDTSKWSPGDLGAHIEHDTSDQFREYLIALYTRSTHLNQITNDRRSAYLYSSRKCLVVITIALSNLAIVNLLPSITKQTFFPEETAMSKQQDATPKPASPIRIPPAPPAPPPTPEQLPRLIKEGEIPKVKN